MNRNAYGPNRRTVVTKDVMTTANAVELEAEFEQCAHGLVCGYCREALWSHGQAAIVK